MKQSTRIKCVGSILFIAVIVTGIMFRNHVRENISVIEAFKQQEDDGEEKEHGLTVITYEMYQEKIKNKETFLVYIGRDSCPYCRLLTPVLEETVSKMQPETAVYYFKCQAYKDAIDEGQEDAKEKWHAIKETLGFKYIPCLFYYEEGELKADYKEFIGDGYFDIKDSDQQEAMLHEAEERLKDWLKENQLLIK